MNNPKINVKEFVKFANKRLHNFEATAKAIAMAWNANQYILLYGKPGYGKSEIFKCFVDFLVEKDISKHNEVFTIPFNENTDADKLFGMDMLHFQNTGVIRFNVKNSFANYEIVRGEEIFDANRNTLAALKLALMDKAIDDGESKFPFRTRMFMGMTNANLAELEEQNDPQINAILDRFPHKVCVDWAQDGSKESILRSHTMADYGEAFKRNMQDVTSNVRDTFALVCAEATVHNLKSDTRPISPRTAYLALNCFIANDMDWTCLYSIPEFPKVVINQAKTEYTKSKLSEKLNDLLDTYEKEITVIKEFVSTKRTDLSDDKIYHVLIYTYRLNGQFSQDVNRPDQVIANHQSGRVKHVNDEIKKVVNIVVNRFGITQEKTKEFNLKFKDTYDSKKARKLLGLD